MRVLLYQPNHTGHHYAYLARMLPGFLDLPIEIVLATTPEGVASDQFTKTLAPYRESIRIETCCSPPPRIPLANARHRTSQLIEAVRRFDPDHVGVMYGDGIWQILAARSASGRWPFPRDLPLELWIYRGAFSYSTRRKVRCWVQRRLFSMALRRGLFAAVHLDDELLFDFARATSGDDAETRVVLTPNPVWLGPPLTLGEARQRMELPGDGRIMSLTGMIAVYKGTLLLLEAFRRLADAGAEPTDRLLLAGPHDDAVRERLAEEPYRGWVADGRILSQDRFITEEEMYTYAAASNLVVAAYPNHHGRSSIILWAAAAGRPSLGASWGCIGHVIEQNGLGQTCNVRDTEELAKHLSQGLSMPWSQADAARVKCYAEFHSIENYQRIGASLVRERARAASATG